MTHLAMDFAIAHRSVTSAILGPRTLERLDDLLAGAPSAPSTTRCSTRSTRWLHPVPTPAPTKWPVTAADVGREPASPDG
jgi:hypothetical protein